MIDKLMRAISLTACIAFTGVPVAAQVKWPEVSQTMKPWTRWWWQGSAVDEAGLSAAMKQYKEAGLGGLEITPIYGVQGTEAQFLDFLSPRWVNMLQFTLNEAKKLDMGIDLATGTGWPFGGPWIDEAHASKYIAHKSFSVKGGETLNENIQMVAEGFVRTANGKSLKPEQLKDPVASNPNMQELAIDQVRFPKPLPRLMVLAYGENGQVMNLSGSVNPDGKLNWRAPYGNWKVYALYEGQHGKMVERAAPGGEGYVIDHFDKKALEFYLEKFNAALKNADLSHLRAWFNDSYEVDDARGQSDWTPGFLDEFSKRRGYRLEKFFPALFDKENTDHQRVLYDYRLTVSDLLLHQFTEPWHAWAAKEGKLIRNQSHGSPSNILDLYSAIDIPETEGKEILRYKFATSAAHVSGKPLASAEAATWLNDHFVSNLGNVKDILDKYFVGGVNHIFYHGTNYSPPDEAWPGWLFYAAVHFHPNNPFWKDFAAINQYVARCQSFLQAGKPANDVLLYFPFHDRLSVTESRGGLLHHFDGMEGFKGTEFEKTGEDLLHKGYTFDLFSDKQMERFSVQNNQILTGGAVYKTILLAGTKFLPLPSLQNIYRLAENGATIVFLNGMPEDVPGMGKLEENRKAFREIMDRMKSGAINENGVSTLNIGRGRILSGNNEEALLAAAGVEKPELPEGVLTIKRTLPDGEYIFFTNISGKKAASWVPLQTKYAHAAVYDAMNGVSGKALVRNGEVYLSMNPGESRIIHVRNQPFSGKNFPVYEENGNPNNIEGKWILEFMSGGPELPPSVEMDELKSWTEVNGEAYQNFSGSAKYSTNFTKPTGNAAYWKIDLGKVGESAEIWLNGKKIATLVGPVFETVIPASSLKASNKLEIIVSNSMANRVIHLEKSGVKWKKFYNINFAANKAENRGADGLFTPIKWDPKPSGLLSAVTLTPMKEISGNPGR